MQVLHISGAMSWRGGEQQLVNLYDALKNLSVEQAIYCPKKSALANYCAANNITYYTYQKTGGFSFFAAIQLKKMLKQNPGFSLLHLHDSDAHTLGYLAFLFGEKTPMVLSRKVIFKIKTSSFTKRKYNAACIKKIICVSETVKKIVAQAIEDKSKLVVVHEGIKPPQPINPDTFLLPAVVEEKHFDFLAGYIAALTSEKDHETFLQTAFLLIKKGLKIGFIIAGSGKEENKIKARIEELGISENVFLIGFCENIPALMKKLNVLLFTSLMEGFSITILEAFFMKLPVVTTNSGGITEMMENGKIGFVSEIRDAETLSINVEKILLDKKLREDIIENAFIFAQQFTYDKMAKNMLKVYEGIL